MKAPFHRLQDSRDRKVYVIPCQGPTCKVCELLMANPEGPIRLKVKKTDSSVPETRDLNQTQPITTFRRTST